MAEWEAAQARRGHVVTTVGTHGQRNSVRDTALEGEEIARREMIEAAAEAAALRAAPVVDAAVVESDAVPIAAVPVVDGVQVAADSDALPALGGVPGGVPALMNTLRLS